MSRGWIARAAAAALCLAPAAARGQEDACPAGETCAPVPAPAAAEPAVQWRAGVEYGYVHFAEDALDPWHTVSADLSAKFRPATVIGRTTWARRFDQDGVQLELDAYPRIAEGMYAYLNAGWSDAEIFPRLRLGAEVYASPGGGTEVSLGARRLEFEDKGVTIYTGSAGLYRGNWYFSARPYVTPRDDDWSVSGSLLARRYFSSAESYATLVVGAGTAPSESPLEFELARTNTRRVGAYGRTPLRPGLGARWSLGYEHEELSAVQERDRLSVSVGLETRF